MRAEENKKKLEDTEYSKIGQYGRMVCLLETLRYCSDAEHTLSIIELRERCIRFCGEWIHEKTIQRSVDLLCEISMQAAWTNEYGGRVVCVALNGKKCGYCWIKTPEAGEVERRLRGQIRRGKNEKLCRSLLDKLGLNVDMKNEEGWRCEKTEAKRCEAAQYIDVRSPYTEQMYSVEAES